MLWPTKNGKGFQLKIEFVPTGPGRIFALPYGPKTREIETENAGDKSKDRVGSCQNLRPFVTPFEILFALQFALPFVEKTIAPEKTFLFVRKN